MQALKSFNILNDAFRSSLHTDSPQDSQPPHIKVPLRAHQKAILKEMEDKEYALSTGYDLSGGKLFSRFAYLGDGVGVGKSLMILGYIAKLKTMPVLPSIPKLDPHSSSSIYSLHNVEYGKDLSEASCLIVVPHTLYRQWSEYISSQTTLKCFGVQTKKNVIAETTEEKNALAAKMMQSDMVLVSNTLFGEVQHFANAQKLIWKRAFFDEADTVHIPGTRPPATARFTWLISASWPNLLFGSGTNYITNTIAQQIAANPKNDPELQELINQSMTSQPAYGGTANAYWYLRYYVVAGSFFREYVSDALSNSFRGFLVVRCRPEFVRESISLPPITIRNIMCKPSVIQQVVANAINADVRALLHAGDVSGALIHLGVKSEEPVSLVQAVTDHKVKELDRLRKTYDFKESLEYSSQAVKEQSLKNIKDKIKSLEEQVRGLRERIENYKDEICPICFDESQAPTLTPCCNRIFCAGCILASLTRTTSCPLCRSNIQVSSLVGLTEKKAIPVKKNEIIDPSKPPEPLKKLDQLLTLIKEIKNGRFLVFSRYDNPFFGIASDLERLNITVKQVRGNKDVIASTLRSFQKGDTQVLLLNSLQAGAGLNITAATHVILLHAMSHEEEKQILGRAYRMGRSEPLEVIRLLHPDEMAHSQHQTHV
jgi:hypothetical protein